MHKLAIKLEGIERRRRTTGLLHIAAGCFLIAKSVDFIFYHQYQQLWLPIAAFTVVLISLLYGFMRKKWDVEARYNHWVRWLQAIFFSLLCIGFLMIDRNWDAVVVLVWAVIAIFLMITERKIFTEMQLLIEGEGLTIPGYISNHQVAWQNIKEVVARPDFITIFQNNNKYLQLELLHHEAASKLETINTYCRQQIKETKNSTI